MAGLYKYWYVCTIGRRGGEKGGLQALILHFQKVRETSACPHCSVDVVHKYMPCALHPFVAVLSATQHKQNTHVLMKGQQAADLGSRTAGEAGAIAEREAPRGVEDEGVEAGTGAAPAS